MAGAPKLQIYREGLKAVQNSTILTEALHESPTHGEWRWRIIGGNGEPLAFGGESYKRRIDMMSAIETVLTLTPLNAQEVDG
ncbi:hypothetical protein GLA29479_3634 [Lysobacter antibioticus]|uniref:DUF1508 domain-containing protein n=1 Tax=Lysobacter antibioticus TaxID=84531 RepID=UPI0007171A7F|nr:YegP family protein [Lysobacter antibioticus]ALN64487.1 hypothetical protein GLA29479_3634 [Lysobacter antibioticus]